METARRGGIRTLHPDDDFGRPGDRRRSKPVPQASPRGGIQSAAVPREEEGIPAAAAARKGQRLDLDLAAEIVRQYNQQQATRTAAEAAAAAAEIATREALAEAAASSAEAAASKAAADEVHGVLLKATAASKAEAHEMRTVLAKANRQIADDAAARERAAAAFEVAEAVEAELRQDAHRQASELVAARQRVADLQNELMKSRAEAEGAGQYAVRTAEGLEEATTELRAHATYSDHVTAKLTEELQATRALAQAHEADAAIAKSTCGELSAALETAQTELQVAAAEHTDEVQAVERAHTALRAVLDSQSAAQATATASVAELEARVQESQAETGGLRRELERAQSVAAASEFQVVECSEAAEMAQRDALSEGRRAAHYETEHARLEAELASLTEEVGGLKQSAVANDELQTEVERLRVDQVDGKIAAMEGGTRTRVMELEHSLRDRTAEVSTLSQQLDALLQEKLDLQTELGSARGKVGDTNALNADLATVERRHEQALLSLRREHASAEERESENHGIALRALKAEASAQSDAFEASRAEHRKALAAAQEDVAHLREQAVVVREKLLVEHEAARERMLAEQEQARSRIEASCTDKLATAATSHASSLAAAERSAEQGRTTRVGAEASASAAHEAELTGLRRKQAATIAAVDVEREAERVRLTDAHAQSLSLLESARIEHKEAVGELREGHVAEVTRLISAHEADIAHLAAQHKAVLAGLSTEQHERAEAMEGLRRQHSQNLVAVDARHAAAIESLQVTHVNALSRQAAETAGALQAGLALHDSREGEMQADHAMIVRELKAAHAEQVAGTVESWQRKLAEAAKAHSSAEEEQEAAAGAALGILSEQQERLLDLQQTSAKQARSLVMFKAEASEQVEAAAKREAMLRAAGLAQQQAHEAEKLQRDGEDAKITAALDVVVAERTRLEGEVEAWRASLNGLRAELSGVRNSETDLTAHVNAMFGTVVEKTMRKWEDRRCRRALAGWVRNAQQRRLRVSLTWALEARLNQLRAGNVLEAWRACIHRRAEVAKRAVVCWATMERRHLQEALGMWRRQAWLVSVARRCVVRWSVRWEGLCLREWADVTLATQRARHAVAERETLVAAVVELRAVHELETKRLMAMELEAVETERAAGQAALIEQAEVAVSEARVREAQAAAAIASIREDAVGQREEAAAQALATQHQLEEKIRKHAAGREEARREAAEAARRFDREVILSWEEIARLRGVDAENQRLQEEVEELSSISLTVGQLRQRADGVAAAVGQRRAAEAAAVAQSQGGWWEDGAAATAAAAAGANTVRSGAVGGAGFVSGLRQPDGRQPPPPPRCNPSLGID